MTTIAYRDGVLAGDTRVTDDSGHVWTDKCKKVFRIKDGSLVGVSGDMEPGELLLDALRAGVTEFKLPADSDINAIRVLADGRLFISEGEAWTLWPEPYAAIGSGKRCALTALRMGYSAREAVRQGIAGDSYSGGRIISVKLKGIK